MEDIVVFLGLNAQVTFQKKETIKINQFKNIDSDIKFILKLLKAPLLTCISIFAWRDKFEITRTIPLIIKLYFLNLIINYIKLFKFPGKACLII